jgi:hypothetical protein
MSRTRVCRFIAAALTIAVFLVGLKWGVKVAGGSDSYGYISQAGLWMQGLPIVYQDVMRSSPWPGAPESWTPLGYRPSPKVPGAIVPMYAPGLPLLIAVSQRVAGFCGAFLVVPFCGALTIWLTFVLGRRLFASPVIALWGAALVATSPVFLYQHVNAMSDVPVTAAWMLALVLAIGGWPLASGLAVSVAILIRPNLVPLAIVLGTWVAAATLRERGRRAAVVSLAMFSVGLLPSIAGIAWLNTTLYESAATSGYGSTGDLYSTAFFVPNVRNYGTWLIEAETPLVAFAGVYFLWPRLFPSPRIQFARLLVGASAAVIMASYLFYRPFDTWWYLRFLLPMWPLTMLLVAAGIDAVGKRSMGSIHPIAAGVVAALLASHGLRFAARHDVFDLWRSERRYIDVARFIGAQTSPDAVVVSMQHSGSLRLYAGRQTLRYDVLDPDWLDRALEHLKSSGRRPYFVLDAWEVDLFRRRFGAVSHAGALDWPAMAVLGSGGAATSVYDPFDRQSVTTPIAIAATRGDRDLWLCDRPQVWPPRLRMK